jgi:hypothetical protein
MLGGVLLDRPALGQAGAQELASRLGVPLPDQVTIAVPSTAIGQAARALSAKHEKAGTIPDRSALLVQLATQPQSLFGASSLYTQKPPPVELSKEQVQQLLGITRSATKLFVDHVWPDPVAKNLVTLGWLAYDGYRMAQAWNDPTKSTLACMVDTSQVALDAFSLLDSYLVFGASPLLAGYHKQMLSTALTIVDDIESGKDATVSTLGIGLDARVKEKAALGDEAIEIQWDLYKLSAKIAAAALSTDPRFKDFKLTPIPHIAAPPIQKLGPETQVEMLEHYRRSNENKKQ